MLNCHESFYVKITEGRDLSRYGESKLKAYCKENKMNTRGLEGVRNALLEAYVGGVIDDYEFAVLLDENESRPIFPYWKVDKFSLDNWDDTECHTELRFKKGDLYDLKRCLRIPDMIQCLQGTICEGMEAMCILLKRLAYPCRYTDMVGRFGRNPTELCLIFNNVLDKIYDTHHRLNSWNQPFLQPAELHRFARSIYDKGAPLDNCFGFIDATVRPICRPNINQRVMYNGHKRVHGIKFQSVVVPNGLIANLSGPYEGKKHDSMMLNESGLLGDLQLNAKLLNINNIFALET